MPRPIFRLPLSVSIQACLLVLLFGTFGCGNNKSQVTGASVTGVVRYQGKPLTGGIIQLWGENKDGNQTAQGGINGDGTYQVLNAPLGSCKVVVKTESVKNDRRAMARKMAAEHGAPQAPESGPPKKYMPINAKYNDPTKTDVQITVQGGKQTQDIDLP